MNVEGDTRVKKYFRTVLPHTTDFPDDILRTVANGGFSTSDKSYDQERQCTKCDTPWVLGAYKARILKWPSCKMKLVRVLLKKQRKCRVRLKEREKLLLSLHRRQQNTLEITCLSCRHKTKVYCSMPKDLRKAVRKKQPQIPVEDVVIVPKKKKRKIKELNAGLLVPSLTNPQTNENDKPSITTQKTCVNDKPSTANQNTLENDKPSTTTQNSLEKNNPSTTTQKPFRKDSKGKGNSQSTNKNTFEQHLSQRLSNSMAIKQKSNMELKHGLVKASAKITSALEAHKSKKASGKTKNESTLSSFLSSLI